MSMVGKMRFSSKRRSSETCWLPVPLNSSKMTSSIRLPVSTSAVAIIVRLPPSSVLRAAPKNFFGLCSALESTPLVDQQHDQNDLGMIVRDRPGQRLQHHGFAGERGGDDQPALPFADRCDQ